MPKNPKSKRGAERQYFTIIRQCYRDMGGGLSFGLDWPTLRATFRERYARIQDLRAMLKTLPD